MKKEDIERELAGAGDDVLALLFAVNGLDQDTRARVVPAVTSWLRSGSDDIRQLEQAIM